MTVERHLAVCWRPAASCPHRKSTAFRVQTELGRRVDVSGRCRGKGNAIENEASYPPWFKDAQVRSGLLEHPFQQFDLCREHPTSQRRQPIIPSSRINCPKSVRRFLNKTFFHQSLQVVVKS